MLLFITSDYGAIETVPKLPSGSCHSSIQRHPIRLEPISGAERQNAVCRVRRRIWHARALWKACSNFCSVPADASTGPNTGARFSSSIVAGLMTAVILFTAAGIAAPLFIIMVVLVLIPWLLWGFSLPPSGCMTATRARGGSSYFTWCRARSAKPPKRHGLAGCAGTVPHYILALAAFALTIWGFVEIGCLRGTAGRTLWTRPAVSSKRQLNGAAS